MPATSHYSNSVILEPINNLKKDYNSDIAASPYKRLKLWFFPSSVRKALESIPEDAESIDCEEVQIIYDALMNHTWFFQRWFFSCLRNFFSGFFGYVLRAHNPAILTTPDYFDLIATHSDPYLIIWAFDSLIKLKILTSENVTLLLTLNKDQLSCICGLDESSILNQEALNIVEQSSNPRFALYAFRALAEVGLYNSTNRAAYLACPNKVSLSNAITRLRSTGLFGSSYMSLLNQSNFNILISHSNLPEIALVMEELRFQDRLTQANFDRALTLPQPRVLANALQAIRNISQDNLELLYRHSDVLLNEEAEQIWAQIFRRTLGAEFFNNIRTIFETDNFTLALRQRKFASYMNDIISNQTPHDDWDIFTINTTKITGISHHSNVFNITPSSAIDERSTAISEETNRYLGQYPLESGLSFDESKAVVWSNIRTIVFERVFNKCGVLWSYNKENTSFVNFIEQGADDIELRHPVSTLLFSKRHEAIPENTSLAYSEFFSKVPDSTIPNTDDEVLQPTSLNITFR